MNEVLRQRLVGLAVLLLLVFLLSLLLPGKPPAEERLPATTVSLTGETLTEADAVPPPDDLPPEAAPEAPPVDSAVAISALSDSSAEVAPAPPPESAPSPPSNPGPAAGLKLAPKVETAGLTPPLQKPKAETVPKPVKPPTPKLAESVANAPPVPGWYVQVGSYSKLDSAKTVVTLLNKLGLRVAMTRITGVKGQPLNRVRAGPYDSEASARAAQAKVAKNGYPQARVVREPSN
jgi:DedD protein